MDRTSKASMDITEQLGESLINTISSNGKNFGSLPENHQQFRQLVDNLPVAFYTTDAQGFISYYNEAAASLWGREPEIGKELWCGSWKIFDPDGVTPVPLDTCPMAIALKEGKSIAGKKIVVERPDGGRSIVLPHPKPILNSDGTIIGAFNVLVDITTTEQSQQAVSNSEANLRALFESSKDSYILIDTEGIILDFNKNLENIYEDVTGKGLKRGINIYDLTPPEKMENTKFVINRVLSGESFETQTKSVAKDGREFWMKGFYNPVKAQDGTVIGICLGASDITAETKALEALRESEERFRMLADTAPVMIWTSGIDKGRNFFNRGWLEFRGQTMESEFGMGWLSGVHPDDLKICRNIYESACDAHEPFRMDYRLRRFDGEYRWITSNGVPRFSFDGTFIGYVGSCIDIHKQRLAEDILRENEEYFRTIADYAPVMIWTAKPDRQRDFFNKQWLEFTGRSYEQELGLGWMEDIHPEDLEDFMFHYDNAFDSKKEYSTLYRVRRNDGEYRWIMAAGIPRFDSKGIFLGLVGSCTDVTDQKKAREELERLVALRTAELQSKNEELLQQKEFVESVIDASIDGITVIDKNMNYLTINKVVEKFWKVDRKNIIGKNIFEAFPDMKGMKSIDMIRKALTGEYVHDPGYTSPLDGRHYEAYFIPLYNGNEVIACITVGHDTTAIHQANERITEANIALESQNQELHRQKKFIETTLDSSVDQICVYDQEGRFIMANKTFTAASGVTEESIIGHSLTEIFPYLIGSKIEDGLQRALKGETVEGFVWNSPGTKNIYNVFCIPLTENGRMFGAMVVAHDNTAILHAAEKVRLNNEELQRMNSDLEQFAYVASHDLQEPLRKIMMFSGRLKDSASEQLADSDKQYLDKIINSSERMSQLIRDILNYSRLGSSTERWERTDLNNIIKEVIADLDMSIEEKQAEVLVGKLSKIEAVPSQMAQLFHNLISNSLKFSTTVSQPKISIEMQVVPIKEVKAHNLDVTQKYVKLVVTDNGIGFDPEYAEKIFVVFQRLHTKQEYAGTGIGLALCQKIVALHHGVIYASSAEGTGAVFSIILPVKQ